jgi:hypothetical protein
MTFEDDLASLLAHVAEQVHQWTGHDAWIFEPGSPASIEVANTEVRLDGSPWGDRPVRTVYQCVQMATKYTVEMARCVSAVLTPNRPSPGLEVLTRSSLEASSVACWILESGLTARQRVCRLQLLRMNSAREMERAIAAVPGASLGDAGSETRPNIESYCHALGLSFASLKGPPRCQHHGTTSRPLRPAE